MSSYCDFARDNPIHAYYHDHEYGFPTDDERVLLERFALEIFQAGLSWEIVLKKRAATYEAFEGFDAACVAAYGEKDIERLLQNDGIIRNQLKIRSIIHNANTIHSLQDEGGFKGWLDSRHPSNHQAWTKLFKKTFRFTGGEIVNEFLMSTGYLPGTHHEKCPIYQEISERNPPWMQVPSETFKAE